MSKFSIIKEFWEFIKYKKIWWITPIIIVLLLIAILIIFTEGSAIAPFIYAIF